jgi:predicted HTH transcriptional regulator
MFSDIPFWLQPESRRLEFKEAWPGGDKIARTAIAFSNGAGGRIVFGVRNEPREIVGLSDRPLFDLEERMSNHIYDTCTPAIVPEVFIQVERTRRKVTFDEESQYHVPWEQLDLVAFTEAFRKATGRELDDAACLNLGLVTEDRDGRNPTAAAILLSEGTVKQRTFPYAKIECARFKGTETKVFLDQATFDGPVHASIEPCIAFIKQNIALGARVGEVYREDRWEYPLEAIREAVTNAVVHRDYSISGNDIKVAVFDDMLEITSPGPLPDTLAPEALGTGRSEIRNRVPAPIFKELGLIEAWGTGIRRMRAELESYPEVELVLQEVTQAFQVQFVRKKAQEGQGAQGEAQEAVTPEVTPEVRLLSVLTGEMSREQIQESLSLKDEKHFRTAYLVPALEAGLIEMTIPDKPRSSKQR